jgi:hypothetical protein
MRNSKNSIIRQFLAGKSRGPIGMDEMSGDVDISAEEVDEDGPVQDEAEQTEIMTV